MNLLLLSNSSSDAGYLVHALPHIQALTQGLPAGFPAVFLPFAGVTRSWDDYTRQVNDALTPTGITLEGLHTSADAQAAIAAARLIVVGGGNTFNLLREVRARGLLAPIAARVRAGDARYLGWSAGANLACPTVCTTNDMPITDPGGFEAFDLIDYQINPHYTNAHPAGHRGETRDQRLAEFCTRNPLMPVTGLREGSALRIKGAATTLLGEDAPLFLGTDAPRLLVPGVINIAQRREANASATPPAGA